MSANLNAMERQLLTYALELAADQMACRDGFDDGDWMALESLRAMATEPAPAADPADTLSAIRTAIQADDITRVRRLVADYYADLRGAVEVSS